MKFCSQWRTSTYSNTPPSRKLRRKLWSISLDRRSHARRRCLLTPKVWRTTLPPATNMMRWRGFPASPFIERVGRRAWFKDLPIRHGKCLSGENGIQLTVEETAQEFQRQDQHDGVRHGVQLRGVYTYICAWASTRRVLFTTELIQRVRHICSESWVWRQARHRFVLLLCLKSTYNGQCWWLNMFFF